MGQVRDRWLIRFPCVTCGKFRYFKSKYVRTWAGPGTLTCSDDCSNKTAEWNAMHLLPISSFPIFHFSFHISSFQLFWATFLVTWGGPRSESSNQISERVIIRLWRKCIVFWKNLPRSSFSAFGTSRPYQAFVKHTVQQSKSSENASPGCKM